LGYNKENEYCFHKKGLLAKIKSGIITNVFETTHYLGSPVCDEDGSICIGTLGTDQDMVGNNEKCKLIKIDSNNIVSWKHEFNGKIRTIPIIIKDSIYIYDHIVSEKIGYLNRFDKNGNLVWQKSFNGTIRAKPLILSDREQMLLILSPVGTLFVLDLDGNLLLEKQQGPWNPGINTFSRGNNGEIYACLNQVLMQLDEKLNAVWSYKPEKGFISSVTVADLHTNLYGKISGTRLVSLDPQGKERWIAEIWGDIACQPIILDNRDILTASSKFNGRADGDIQYSSFLEIFSPNGTKLFKYEILGTITDVIVDADDNIYIASSCSTIMLGEERENRFIRIYSLKILN
jgi:hypothetical protein